ncbi:hypothetical protein WJX74_009117 [Apatococcus lobatus]|uniref:Uncharacterized protein n=1 Tax=Apatococcus lobatus TaxID=904363 RepID=A0AAW1QI54_9CHLO
MLRQAVTGQKDRMRRQDLPAVPENSGLFVTVTGVVAGWTHNRGQPMTHQGHGSFRSFLGLRQRHTQRSGLKAAAADRNVLNVPSKLPQGASTDLSVIWRRLRQLAVPYWKDSEVASQARWRLAGVVALTLGTTGVSVMFNFLGRDFFNALSEKDAERFTQMLFKWLGALTVGIPVFVFRSYYQDRLALEWRNWMTEDFTKRYFENRTFYQVQVTGQPDNPDQRVSADIKNFTETALNLSTTILQSCIDLVSFSGILYTIYPPLFAALLIYSIGGTSISLYLGKNLVGLNFQQEAQEANFRYGLVRVRENAESIAFYGGEASEAKLLFQRLVSVVENYGQLIKTSRNLQFFTSFYRFVIQILPAAVVAPLYFSGKIGFGVVNQSSSAFNHILTDISLVVYQFETLAGFSAVIDRLGEFMEVLDEAAPANSSPAAPLQDQPEPLLPPASSIQLSDEWHEGVGIGKGGVLLDLQHVTLRTPDSSMTLVEDLTLQVKKGESLLIVGPSGAGKTSIMRAIAGLWTSGEGSICRYGRPVGAGSGGGDIFFVPQRPYVVLGSLREQLLYPTWADAEDLVGSSAPDPETSDSHDGAASSHKTATKRIRPPPRDAELQEVLRRVQLGGLLSRQSSVPGSPAQAPVAKPASAPSSPSHTVNSPTGSGRQHGNAKGLDAVADWAGVLSLGEQQRLAFARVLLCRPALVLMDESSSALDTVNEKHMYNLLKSEDIVYVSVGHRPTLRAYHDRVLQLLDRSSNNDAETQQQQQQCNWKLLDAATAELS